MVKPHIRFDINNEAAEHNFKLLKDADFNLDTLLNRPNEVSVTSYSSEFKSTSELQKLLKDHPRWPALKI